MDDKHIVAQARRGELSAFEELVTRYEKRVYAIALRSSGARMTRNVNCRFRIRLHLPKNTWRTASWDASFPPRSMR